MENLLRRVRVAERVIGRRAKKVDYKKLGETRRQERSSVMSVMREARDHLREARQARRDAWELGPLAPRRDISHTRRDGGAYYGTLSADHAGLAAKTLTDEQKRARVAWCGTPGFVCLELGDRVVVLDGPYRNHISVIKKMNKDNMTVTLDQNTMVNQTMPSFVQGQMNPVEPWEAPIPISSVRLVHPLQDPATGRVRDVIIRELRPFNRDFDRPTRKWTFDRVIPGENVVIPWPAKQEPKKETHANDTTWADVDERTFVPTLLSPPMPEMVLDELRNRYSRFRTRHTKEYVAEKEAEAAAKEARKRSVDSMLLPVQEFNRKRREERRALGQPELTEEMLAKIGEVMEKNARLRGKGKAPENIQEAVAQLSIQDGPAGEQPRP